MQKQRQSDVIGLIKQYILFLPVLVEHVHVFWHLNDVLRLDQLTDIEQLIVLMDSLSKRAPLASIANRIFIDEGLYRSLYVVDNRRCGPH